jgi:peptidoglycan/LPS O-acetylase OafA/YrhL
MYGMPLFFVLSGFVIHYNYRSLFESLGPVRASVEFLAARAARLFPLYFFLLAFALFADDFFERGSSNKSSYLEILAYYTTLTQSWWYVVFDKKIIINTLFPLSWSISTEWFFYLAYIPIVYTVSLIRGWGRAALALVIFCILVYAGLASLRTNLDAFLRAAQLLVGGYISHNEDFGNSFFRWIFYFSPYARVFEFFSGVLTAHLVITLMDRPVEALERRMAGVAVALALAALTFQGAVAINALPVASLHPLFQFMELNFLCAPPIAVLLFCLSRYDLWVSRFLSWGPLVLLGEISYSLYLVHTWTLGLLNHASRPLTPIWGLEAFGRILFGIIFTVIVSYGTYRLIEIPSRRWLRQVFAKGIVLGFGESSRPSAGAGRGAFAAAFSVVLVAACAGGQLAQDRDVQRGVHHAFTGGRPEIRVIEATYGFNCTRDIPGVPRRFDVSRGNATAHIAAACDDHNSCEYVVSVEALGDAAPQCPKDYSVTYTCSGSETQHHEARLGPEANGHATSLRCPIT